MGDVNSEFLKKRVEALETTNREIATKLLGLSKDFQNFQSDVATNGSGNPRSSGFFGKIFGYVCDSLAWYVSKVVILAILVAFVAILLAVWNKSSLICPTTSMFSVDGLVCVKNIFTQTDVVKYAYNYAAGLIPSHESGNQENNPPVSTEKK